MNREKDPNPTTLKLIFKDGTIGCQELTDEALNVCKLLAIDPNDILLRDISEFHIPGFSEKRIQYRFEYYEEKR